LKAARSSTGLLVLFIALFSAAAVPSWGAPGDQALIRQISAQMNSAGGSSGAWVADASTGQPFFERFADVRRTPASIEKLLTTSAVLERWGSDFELNTLVRSDGVLGEDGVLAGNLYLQGFGDPSFDTPDLSALSSRVREAGIERVEGRVYGDESYFDSRRGLPAAGFRLSADIGPLSALSFNEGTLRGFGHGFQADPPKFVAERLRHLLEARGVEVARAARRGSAPSSTQTIASVSSPPIAALVRHTNQVSDNYYAETLLKGLGAQVGRSGSTAAGTAVVRRFEQAMGASSTVRDGSGLSRSNAISPHAVGRLLLAARRQPWFDPFYRSLPLAGRSGTLRKRMRRTAAAGRCRAKTGTLLGVSGLAGYCRSRAGREFVFALLMNGVNVWRARAAQDRIVAALAGA
jgi:D-alanyl-D-alanine carboxypeptidase/D-alanyl-D-alanine-endopeptidase (penicillin-binding protein 4)